MRAAYVHAYRTQNSYSTLDEAQDRVEELMKKHPDRSYEILFNDRKHYRQFTVARMTGQWIKLPEEGLDYFMPPKPVPYYNGYWEDLNRWEEERWRKRGDPEGQVKL